MEAWIENRSLRVHMEAVAACMGSYAAILDPTQADRWIAAGLLHDFDYERHPSREEHPFVGVEFLKANHPEFDSEILEAILGHADYSGVVRSSPMAKTLFAVDELAGFIVACAKVRPDGIASLEVKSVRKKLKDKSFAAAVSREDIALGIAQLNVDESEHLGRCIDAIRSESVRLAI